MGIDPITHKPISQLLADLAGSIALPKGSEIAEATLGCFKDDMLNVLMRKRTDQHIQTSASMSFAPLPPQQSWELQVNSASSNSKSDRMFEYDLAPRGEMDAFAQKIKSGLSTAMQSKPMPPASFVSAPCGPVSGVRSASGALSRSMAAMPGQQLLAREGTSSMGFAHFSAQEFAFNQDQMSRSMLDMLLLEPNRFATSTYEKEVPDLNLMTENNNRRSSAPSLQPNASADADQMLPAPPTTKNNTQGGQDTQFTSSDQLPELSQQQLYMSLLQQQECSSFQPFTTSAQVKTTARTMGQNSRPETIAWSPSCSGSSSSSTSLPAAEVSSLDGVLSSDALLWDFPELGSMVS